MEQSEKETKAGVLHKAAQIVSDVLSPLLVPTYCMAMAMWITPLQVLPERTRLGATLGVAIITAIIPLCVLLIMLRTGRISHMSTPRRSERSLPMAIAALSYAGAALYLSILHAPLWLTGFFCGAAVATVVALLINLCWKISAHCISIGGMAGMTLWIAAARLATVDAVIWLTSIIILGGIVASARLILDRHTPAQTAAGWLWGCVCVFFSMCFFC